MANMDCLGIFLGGGGGGGGSSLFRVVLHLSDYFDFCLLICIWSDT